MSDLKQKSSVRPAFVSFGTREKEVLRAVMNHGASFKRRAFAAGAYGNSKCPPSSALDVLGRLVAKGYLEKPSVGIYHITESGKHVLGAANTGVEGRQAVCRGRETLSMHAIKFEFGVKVSAFFDVDELQNIGVVKDSVQMQGWMYHRVDIDNASLRIYPNKVVCFMSEKVGDDVEKVLMQALDDAALICKKLETAGLICDVIKVDRAEYARVEDVFADTLVKKLGRYRYTLKDGTSFWIDFSGGKIERETDNIKLAARVDDFVEDLKDSSSVLSDVDVLQTDVDGLKQVAHMVLQHDLNVIRLQNQQIAQVSMSKDQKKVVDYFG